jgi:hypothetical protein
MLIFLHAQNFKILTARILKSRAQNFNLNISKYSSYHNFVDYQFSSNLELVYCA